MNNYSWRIFEIIKEEGDLNEWIDPFSKYNCRVLRNPHLGFWLGYVDIPEDHPFYGKHYDFVNNTEKISVHGGLTYSHEQQQDKKRYWRLGFDCGHAGDYIPLSNESFMEGCYRTIEYVTDEVTSLAKQLYDMGKRNLPT